MFYLSLLGITLHVRTHPFTISIV